MILLVNDNDDTQFLTLVQNIIINVVRKHSIPFIRIEKIDNWFDHKWLGFKGGDSPATWKQSRGSVAKRNGPSFSKSRTTSMEYYSHINGNLELINSYENFRWWECKTSFYFSGNTISNMRGSLMSYIPAEEDLSWFWYVSFIADPNWRILKLKGISLSEIEQYQI
jgi:hypothetical protein